MKVKSVEDLETYQLAFGLQETGHWLRSANACGYLSSDSFEQLSNMRQRVGSKLGYMIKNSDIFCIKRPKP